MTEIIVRIWKKKYADINNNHYFQLRISQSFKNIFFTSFIDRNHIYWNVFLVFVSAVLQNFILVIERVEPYDGAKYICEITSPEMSITHVLEVNGATFIFFGFLMIASKQA
ncbi:unnamed protein product [Brugia timori]|uniref:Ig-like domain-containing protein n=1 Tax=Brugia timori TaxID=42155 RepID=A0A0R3QCJ6_9BILA|nr:unnamed protein product [Brugia timori]